MTTDKTLKSKLSKPITRGDIIIAVIIVTLLLVTVVINEIFYRVPGSQALRKIWPIFFVGAIVEKYIRKKRKGT